MKLQLLLAFIVLQAGLSSAAAQDPVPSVRLVTQGPDGMVIRFEMADLQYRIVQTEQGEALVPSFKGSTPLLEAGAPDLPKFAALLQVAGAEDYVAEVLQSEFEEIRNVLVAPSKGDLLRTVDPNQQPFIFGETYGAKGFYPDVPVSLRPVFRQRELHGLPVWIQPLQYEASTRTLRRYSALTIRIRPAKGQMQIPAIPAGVTFDQLYKKLYLNYQGAASTGSEAMDRLLVVAPDAWETTLAPLLEWKRQSGIHTRFLPLSLAGGGDPEILRQTIRDIYAAEAITHILLAGDEFHIGPIMRPSGGSSYSCDNCFGYLDDDDHILDMLVGRLHAADERQLVLMVQRILEYEKSPSMKTGVDWFATGMASASEEGAGFGDDGQADYEHANEWKAKYLESGFGVYGEFYDGDHGAESPTPGHPSADQPGNPESDSLVARINNGGLSIYNYTGHGWEQGLASGNFSTDAVAKLRNEGAYPILIAVACCAGNFTNGECLGEAWQRAGDTVTVQPWGGIAGFFSSDFQSWSPPMEGQDAMNQYLIDADGVNLFPSIGGMAAYGNTLMIAAYGNGGEVMADFWNPFADPTTLPRNAWPDSLTAALPDSTTLGATELQVACSVEGARIGLYHNGQTLAAAWVQNGMATLTFPPLSDPESIVVTVTQFNYIPFQSSISVGSIAGPFLACRGVKVDDASGNGNALMDYRESFHLDLELSNYGGGSADSAHLQLIALHPGVLVENAAVTIGAIAAGTDLLADNAFQIQVIEDLPHGTELPFRILIMYGQDSGTCDLTLPLQAPDLRIDRLNWRDTLAFGNGNGRLEAGELAAFTFDYRNAGGSDSPELTMEITTDSPWITFSTAQVKQSLGFSNQAVITFEGMVASDVPAYAPFHVTLHVGADAYGVSRTFGPFWLEPIVEDFESQTWDAFEWKDSLQYPWVIVDQQPWQGAHCARSADIEDLQFSEMRILRDVVEDGFVGFARRVSSEAGWDFLRFYIDGQLQAEWTGELPWEEFRFPVTTGQHEFSWRYEKDEIISEGQDLAWVDDIYLPLEAETVSTDAGPVIEGKLTVQPNPAFGPVRVEWASSSMGPGRLELWTAAGQVLWMQEIELNGTALVFPLDLSGQPAGWYLIRAVGAGETRTLPLLLTH